MREKLVVDNVLELGDWVKNVPLYKRFAIVTSRVTRKQWMGGKQWTEQDEYCAIDMLRGFKSPYFGYYDIPHRFFKERILPMFEADTDEAFQRELRNEWNFFRIDDHREEDKKFAILDYVAEDKDEFHVVGVGEYKTFEQHREDLKQKYSNPPLDKQHGI